MTPASCYGNNASVASSSVDVFVFQWLFHKLLFLNVFNGVAHLGNLWFGVYSRSAKDTLHHDIMHTLILLQLSSPVVTI